MLKDKSDWCILNSWKKKSRRGEVHRISYFLWQIISQWKFVYQMLKQFFNYICLDINRIRLPGWWLSCSLGGMAGEWTWTPETFGRRFLGIFCHKHVYEWNVFMCRESCYPDFTPLEDFLVEEGKLKREQVGWYATEHGPVADFIADPTRRVWMSDPTQAFCCGLEASTGWCAMPFSSHWSQKGGITLKKN